MQPLMPKATAVWLVDNTTLTFDQIAEFVGMHPLEISGIADGEVAIGIKGFDPIANNQLTRGEIERCEKDPKARLKLAKMVTTPEQKKKRPRYTPVSKRQDRPAAIAWLVRNHPELADAQIVKLLGTTKTTIEAIRTKNHWNSNNIQPVDPVALGLCRQIDLDDAVRVAAAKKAKELAATGAPPPSGASLMPMHESLVPESASAERLKGFEELDPFATESEPGVDPDEEVEDGAAEPANADALFNLPSSDAEHDEDEPGR